MMWSEFGLNSLRRNKIRNISELSCAAMAQPLSTTTMNRLMNDGKVKTLLKSRKPSMMTSLKYWAPELTSQFKLLGTFAYNMRQVLEVVDMVNGHISKNPTDSTSAGKVLSTVATFAYKNPIPKEVATF